MNLSTTHTVRELYWKFGMDLMEFDDFVMDCSAICICPELRWTWQAECSLMSSRHQLLAAGRQVAPSWHNLNSHYKSQDHSNSCTILACPSARRSHIEVCEEALGGLGQPEDCADLHEE